MNDCLACLVSTNAQLWNIFLDKIKKYPIQSFIGKKKRLSEAVPYFGLRCLNDKGNWFQLTYEKQKENR